METPKVLLDRYIGLRRSLGYKLHAQHHALLKFVDFLAERGEQHVTRQLALEWALLVPGRASQSIRLSYVRQFAKYLLVFDGRTEIPQNDLLPCKRQRPRPYIYRPSEVHHLLEACLALPVGPITGPLRPWSYYCLFGLIYVTGMRVAEAASLRLDDVDLTAKILIVRFGKFGKSRLIPISDSTVDVLRHYMDLHASSPAGLAGSRYLFPTKCGGQLDRKDIHATFYRVSREIGIREHGAAIGPRIHDLRHTFAVETLVRWYDRGLDPELCLPLLATYLGHVGYEHTYWYLSLNPELMRVSLMKAKAVWGEL